MVAVSTSGIMESQAIYFSVKVGKLIFTLFHV